MNKFAIFLGSLCSVIMLSAASPIHSSPAYISFKPAREVTCLIFDRTQDHKLIISEANQAVAKAGYGSTTIFQYKLDSQKGYSRSSDKSGSKTIFWMYASGDSFKEGRYDLYPEVPTINYSGSGTYLSWGGESVYITYDTPQLTISVNDRAYTHDLTTLLEKDSGYQRNLVSTAKFNIDHPRLRVLALGDLDGDSQNDLIVEVFYHIFNPLGDGSDALKFSRHHLLFMSSDRTDSAIWDPTGQFKYYSNSAVSPNLTINEAIAEQSAQQNIYPMY